MFAQQTKRACALSGPASTCTSIESNGDIKLKWTIPSDPNGVFTRYEVYRTGTLGPILKIPTLINQDSAIINSVFSL